MALGGFDFPKTALEEPDAFASGEVSASPSSLTLAKMVGLAEQAHLPESVFERALIAIDCLEHPNGIHGLDRLLDLAFHQAIIH